MSSREIRIATRKSALALWQAEDVKACLEKAHPGLLVTLGPMVSRGDKLLDSPLSINTAVKGRTLAATLRDRSAILLKAHGAVVVGTDIVECFALAAYLEENAQRQYRALQIGAPYVLSAAEQQACRDHLRSPSLFRKTWDHYRSNLSTEGTNRDLDTAPRRPL